MAGGGGAGLGGGGLGFSATAISILTFATATPAALGLIIGGRTADVRGRRRLVAVAIPVATSMSVVSFSVAGPPMWVAAFLAGFIGSIAYPALAVYRAELFPTGNRGRAAGLLTASALLGERGQGWAIANQLLAYERGPSDVNFIARIGGYLRTLEHDVLFAELVSLPLPAPLYLAGIEDPGPHWSARGLELPALERLAAERPADGPTLLLVHRPEAFAHAARLGFPLGLGQHLE